MSERKDSLLIRLGGGAFAIFAGVALALAADDWRQGREEAREAEESLALLAEDLRLDSARLDAYAGTMRDHAAVAAWLAEHWQDSNPPIDTVETMVFRFYVGGLLSFNRATYEGLSNSNRLRLVRDDAVRTGIRTYYGRSQPSLIEFWELDYQVFTRLLQQLALHFQQPLGEQRGSLWPYGDRRATIRHEWRTVSADAALEETIHQHGVLAEFLAIRIVAARDEATALLRLIADSELGS